MTGLVALVAAVVAAGVLGLVLKARNGRFVERSADEVLGPAELGVPLGECATLVQFSSAFCSPCRATRVLLADVAGSLEGVVTVDIDAESRLDLVRRLDVMRTPTVLVLDAAGVVTTRASGLPKREQVVNALATTIRSPR